MISVKLLNGNIISRDADFSKYIETVSEPWVIKWFVVSATKVGIGMARVPVSRSNGEKLFVLVISDSETSISGDGDVYINIPQEIIDNWEIANEDWTGIATIEVGTMPSKNALKLATISNGAVTDERNILKKVSDLEPLISDLDERTSTLEEEIGEILDKWAIDHLEESWMVWEKYTLSDTLFHQLEPISSNCTLEQNVADVSANTEIHIQRIASWTESNQLNLKLKKVWAPTQNLIVEVRRGVKVDVSSNEAYWYWDEVITSSEIAYGNITTDFAEYTVTFPESFWANQWDLLDIVLYQNWKIVNDINYYVIACDSTQYSEAFSYVAVNGTTRVRSKLMPYCSSVGFAQSLLCKVEVLMEVYSNDVEISTNRTTFNSLRSFTDTDYKPPYTISFLAKTLTSRPTSPNNAIRLYDIQKWDWITYDIKHTDYRLYTCNNFHPEINNIDIQGRAYSSSDKTFIKDVHIYRKISNQWKKILYQYSWIMVSWTYSFTSNVTWTITFRYDVSRGSEWSQYAPQITIKKNGTQVYQLNWDGNTWPKMFELEVNTGDVIDMITERSQEPASQAIIRQIKNMTVITSWMEIELRPSRIYEIWVVWVWTTFWTINWVFKWWQFIGTDTAATTWTITLWNAVWFLEVNYMWEIYKVPYYK